MLFYNVRYEYDFNGSIQPKNKATKKSRETHAWWKLQRKTTGSRILQELLSQIKRSNRVWSLRENASIRQPHEATQGNKSLHADRAEETVHGTERCRDFGSRNASWHCDSLWVPRRLFVKRFAPMNKAPGPKMRFPSMRAEGRAHTWVCQPVDITAQN